MNTAQSARILVVDDDPYVREALREHLEHAGFRVLEAADGKVASEVLDREEIDLVLLDLELPRVSGLDLLAHMADDHAGVAVLIVSGKGSVARAVDTMKLGAFDFLEKPIDSRQALASVRQALAASGRRKVTDVDTLGRYGMIGGSPSMVEVFRSIDRAAATSARVLVVGESGSGKEKVARAIHRLGAASDAPFVPVNCAAIPESLVESELFGHERGAFSGAHRSRKGYFQRADGGTLFLDEVGDMSLMTQAKVLRAVEDGRIARVGSERSVPVELRLMAATNRDLRAEVREGNFREDLYYRLNVIVIQVPPLRRRKEDLPDLATYFLSRAARETSRPGIELTAAARAELASHDWPGNVRELRNAMDRVAVFCRSRTAGASDVRAALRDAPPTEREEDVTDLRQAREDFERAFISASLERNDWRIQVTAKSLGINRTHLWKKMKNLGMSSPA